MDIVIKVENAREEYITFSNINLKPPARKYVWSSCFYGALGMAAILLGLANDLAFLSGLGAAFLFIGLTVYVQYERYKQNYLSAAEKNKQLLYGNVNHKTIGITYEHILVESHHLKEKLDWSLITSYMLTNEYILLIMLSSFAQAVRIRRSLLTPEEQQELLSFLEKSKPRTLKADKPV
jgi:hypothetical protein